MNPEMVEYHHQEAIVFHDDGAQAMDMMYDGDYNQLMESQAEYFDRCTEVEPSVPMDPPQQCQKEDRVGNDDAYHYENDALLKLIVGVQSYLTDMAATSSSGARQDSPLLDLQYKMYMYLKQRACDMGVDIDALNHDQQL